MEISRELDAYNLVYTYECSPADGAFRLADTGNEPDSKQLQVEVDFAETILPLISEKKELQMDSLGQLCEEK